MKIRTILKSVLTAGFIATLGLAIGFTVKDIKDPQVIPAMADTITTGATKPAVTPLYNVQFSYSIYRGASTTAATTILYQENNVYTSQRVMTDEDYYQNWYFQVYGSGYTGSASNATSSTYLGSTAITISTNSGFNEPQYTVTNIDTGKVWTTSTINTFIMTAVPEGNYRVDYLAYSRWTEEGNIRDIPRVLRGVASFEFKVELTGPTLSGASTSTTGKYTNTSFTVTASDSKSGVATMYWLEPSATTFSSFSGTSKTIASGSKNGLYTFYAVDKCGNESERYYVYYDNTLPVGTVKDSNGSVLANGSSTTKSFYYTAADGESGVSRIEHRVSGQTAWAGYTAGTYISSSDPDGIQQFRTYDKAGNVSEIYSVTLDKTKPTGKVYGGTTEVSSGGKTKASYVKYVPTDKTSGVKQSYVLMPGASSYVAYSSGAQLTSNGTYYFYSVDNAGNTSSTVSITLDNTKPTITSSVGSSGSTISQGFTITATDNMGTPSLYYKLATGSGYVLSSTNSVTIPISYADGTYYFYAVDSAGNQSSTFSITLSVPAPTAMVIRPDNGNIACVVWSESGCSALLNDRYYSNGTWVTKEGDYTCTITNSANRITTLNFSIDHYYVVDKTVSPTCTEKGYSVYKCQNCGDAYNADYVNALGHSYSSTVVASTCTAQGYTLHTCTGCGTSYTDNYTDVLAHSYGSWTTVTAPTCTKTGSSRRDCKNCSHYETRTDAALGHNYVATKVDSTCTAQGYTVYVCSRCNDTYTSGYTDMTEHSYGSWFTVTAPTCTEKGSSRRNCSNCSYYETRVDNALGHSYVSSKVSSTCSVQGYTLHTCSRCNDSYKDSYTDLLAHPYGSWFTVTAPTCTEKGSSRRNCSNCSHYETRTDAELGHNFVATKVASTCTTQGYTNHTCSRCDVTYNDTYVALADHTYKDVITQPTCEDRGFTTHTCTVCKSSYVDSYTNALGHNFGDWYTTKAATCVDTGTARRDCGRCSHYETKVVSPLGHEYVSKITLPTCLDKGYTAHSCLRCKTSYIDSWTNALGHTYEEEVIAPSCMEEGYTLHKCVRCEDSYKSDNVSMLGHNYSEVFVPATCEEAGGLLHTCLRCGDAYKSDVVNPAGHDYETKVILPSTCSTDGERSFHCSKCGELHYETIPSQGHQYTILDEKHSDGKVYRSYTCYVCAYSYETAIGEEYEKVSNYIEYLFEEYSPYMMYIFLATAGVWSIAMGVALIIAKKNEDQVKAKKMLVNYIVGLVAIFIILVAAPYLVKGIASLIS